MRQVVRIRDDGVIEPVIELGRPHVVFPPHRRRRPIYLSGVGCPQTDELELAGADIGLLVQPESHLEDRALLHRVWAADNGCFSKGADFDLMEWITWVSSLTRPELTYAPDGEVPWARPVGEDLVPFGCLFVAAPDVFNPATGKGDPVATWERSGPTLEWIRMLGFPAALVAQDGLEAYEAPWRWAAEWDVLFIGGSTEWKLSERARECVEAAHALGKWVHMGRVNSWKRLELAASWNVDSVDGTFLAFGPRTNGPKLAAWLDRLDRVPALF